MKLAVLGAKGLLGSDLVNYLSEIFDITPITRQNYDSKKGKKFDLFINANGNSKRYWALQNVYQDFESSTQSVYKTLFDFKFEKYIYISSVDVYPDPSGVNTTLESDRIDITKQNVYGFHKYLSEQIVRKNIAKWLILRPSSILGNKLNKGPIYDVLNRKPLFITLDSRLQYITTKAISDLIVNLHALKVTNEIFNVGGIGTYDFADIQSLTNNKVSVSREAKKQQYEMDINKVKKIYPSLLTSEDYLKRFLNEYRLQGSK